MTDARNTDFLRQHARLDRRVSNLETGVHPVKSDMRYENVGTDGGGGIQFDTDNEGGWLYIRTNDATEAGGSVSGYGIELADDSGAGIRLHAGTGGDIHLDATSQIQMTATDFIIAQSLDGIQLSAANNTYIYGGQSAVLGARIGSTFGMFVKVDADAVTILWSPSADPNAGNPIAKFDVVGCHLPAGTDWIDDL